MTNVVTESHEGLQTDWPSEPAGPRPSKRGPLRFVHELPVLLVIAFTIAVLIKTFLLQAFFIPSESMLPTLEIGDRVLVNKLAYRLRDPRRGEVIVFIAEKDRTERSFLQRVKSLLTEGLGVTTPKERDFIKRIIGLPGDTIEVTPEGTYITPPGAKRFKVAEPYIYDQEQQGPAQHPFVVPKDTFFYMGDNRSNSQDSRFRGPIKRSEIIGKAFVKIWPPSRMDVMEAPSYPKPTPAKTVKSTPKRKTGGTGAPPPGGVLPVIAAVLARRRAA